MKRIKRARRTPLEAAQANEHQRRSSTYYGAARDRWITWAFPNTWRMAYPNHASLSADPERLVGSLLLLGSPALTKSQDTPQACMITDVTFGRSDEWFPSDGKRNPIPGWLVTLQPQRDNATAAEQLLGLYMTARAIRQTATMDHVTARANFRWGVYPLTTAVVAYNRPPPVRQAWWVCLEERREDGSFGYAETWKVPELRGKNVHNKFRVHITTHDGSVTIPLGFLLGALDGLNPNSTDTQEAAAAADPAAQAAHAEGFRLLTPGTQHTPDPQNSRPGALQLVLGPTWNVSPGPVHLEPRPRPRPLGLPSPRPSQPNTPRVSGVIGGHVEKPVDPDRGSLAKARSTGPHEVTHASKLSDPPP